MLVTFGAIVVLLKAILFNYRLTGHVDWSVYQPYHSPGAGSHQP